MIVEFELFILTCFFFVFISLVVFIFYCERFYLYFLFLRCFFFGRVCSYSCLSHLFFVLISLCFFLWIFIFYFSLYYYLISFRIAILLFIFHWTVFLVLL